MTVRSQDGRIVLEGRCRVEDAETLLTALQHQPDGIVHLDGAGTLHTAVVQVLLAAKPRMEGIPRHGFLTKFRILTNEG